MNRRFLRDSLRHAGLGATLSHYLGRALDAAGGVQVFRLLCLTPETVRGAPADAGIPIDRQRLLEAALDPAAGLDRAEVLAALDRGEACYGLFDGPLLASHDFCTDGPAHLTGDLDARVAPEWIYSRWAFTAHSHRGRGLHAEVKRQALTAAVAEGRRGILSLVNTANVPSLRAGERLGCRWVGTVVVLQRGGRPQVWLSPECRRLGFEVGPAAEIRASSELPSRATRVRRILSRLETAAVKADRGRLAVLTQVIQTWRDTGIRPAEALALGLGDPGLPREVLGGCFGKARLMALQDALNPRDLVALTEDKGVFYARCEALGIPVPRTFAAVEAGGGWVAEGQPPADHEAWARHLDAVLPASFVTKPSLGVYGEAVTLWTRSPAGFTDHLGCTFTAAELHRKLTSHPKYRRFLVQERLVNHAEIVGLTGCAFLQTVRVATLVSADGAPEVLYAELKVIAGDRVTDNYCGGTVGNLVVNVARETGALAHARRASPDGVGAEIVPAHPATGVPFEGFALPDWPALLALAGRCALAFLPLRTIGWDLALTPRGPVVVEGNRWWDPPNDALLGPHPPGFGLHDLVHGAERLRREAAQARAHDGAPPPPPRASQPPRRSDVETDVRPV